VGSGVSPRSAYGGGGNQKKEENGTLNSSSGRVFQYVSRGDKTDGEQGHYIWDLLSRGEKIRKQGSFFYHPLQGEKESGALKRSGGGERVELRTVLPNTQRLLCVDFSWGGADSTAGERNLSRDHIRST